MSEASSASVSFGAFVIVGIEHILTGYDHLLFLVALEVAGLTLRSAAGIITSFTVAHSLTFALAVLGVVSVPASVVEPLVALSVCWVALENIVFRNPRRRWLLTFGFGLIHGLGFASALEQTGLVGGGASSVLLVAFNVGVEVGQLAVAALVLPIVWQLQRRPERFRKISLACSGAVSVVGAIWIVERVVFS